MISGTTRVAAVIGSPVHHSLSPALHNAAFAQLGLDWVYVALHVAHGDAQRAVDAVRTFGLGGLSVTMPHKEAVALAVDRLDPAAAALRSVNTVVHEADGTLVGHSTDGAGLVASLLSAGHRVEGRSVCVLGAGAAGRSIVDALGRAGAADIAIVNRTQSAAEEAATLGGAVAHAATSTTAIRDAEIVVHTTPVGMGGTGDGSAGELPCDPDLLHRGQVVVDIVYHPIRTALLAAASRAGAATVDGLGMLVHQAVIQQQLWHGRAPDAGVMRMAAEAELTARAR